MAHQTHRIYTFDLLRGLAVLTMMLAHSVYFFHVRDNAALIGIENFGNTVSFITFLLVSGAVTWVAMFSHDQPNRPVHRKRVAQRVFTLLLTYYLLAVIASIPDLLHASGVERVRLLGNLLSFRILPGFMEYFPPFIFYSAAIGFFPGIFSWVSQRFRYVLLASLIAYIAGDVLARLAVGPLWQPWLNLIAGGEGVYRFPFLQYLPIFFLGLFWGHQTVVHSGLAAKRELVSRLGWLAVYGVLVAYLITTFSTISIGEMFSRWPPSVPFLALGLAFAFLVTNLLYRARQLRRVPLVRDGLLVLGQNALGIFWSHIFLLKLYEMAGGQQVSSPLIVFGLFALLVIVSVALTTFLPFNYRLALTMIRGSHEEHEETIEKASVVQFSQDLSDSGSSLRKYFLPNQRSHSQRLLRRRHQFGLTLLAIVGAALIFPIASEELALQRQQRGSETWWNDNAAYRQPVTLQYDESFVTLPVGTTVNIRLNHAALVTAGKSRADGHDLVIAYWNGDRHVIPEQAVVDPNTTTTALRFRLPASIEGKKPKSFYSLYYGEFLPQPRTLPPLESSTLLTIRVGAEESRPLIGNVSQHWNVIGQTGSNYITFTLESHKAHDPATATYAILDTELTGVMVQTSPTSWTASVPVDQLNPGVYKLQGTLLDPAGQPITSTVSGFYRTHPLYVAWTQDWEGYDANQSYIDAIDNIATEFQLPITHFVNPSLYTAEAIPSARAKTITQWLQRRFTQGDGFGLHLHLFHEFVEYAGVEVRKEPNWGDRGDGYGVPLSAYTVDEQEKLIKAALDLLPRNGLPQTTLFRAGGWFANLDTLQALERLGFTVDSSARTAYTFGRNRLPGHWNVAPTATPYFPSRTNQNASGEKNFPILEIPNNGADSYAFSSAAMIDRFTVNFRQGILPEPQQVTYISHPHWFDDKEQARVRELFGHINRYTLRTDQGPVIYTTTERIAERWSNE